MNTTEVEKEILTEVERGILIECDCGQVNDCPLNESEPFKITGKPKLASQKNCSMCGKEINVYVSIWIPEGR